MNGDVSVDGLVVVSGARPNRAHAALVALEERLGERFLLVTQNVDGQSSLAATEKAALLLVIGTSGATNLPTQMCTLAARRGAKLVVVDPEHTPFAALAQRHSGTVLHGTATELIPALCERIA